MDTAFDGNFYQKGEGVYNAGHTDFGVDADGDEVRIEAAITAAALEGVPFVLVPDSMLPYDPSAVAFNDAVLMVREGQLADVVDVQAYGAAGDGPTGTDDLAAIDAAASAADATGRVVVWHPPGTYTVSGDPTFPGSTAPVGEGASYDGSTTTIASLIPESAVTAHEGALSIAETQIPDGSLLARLADNETVAGGWTFSNRPTVDDGSTNTAQAAQVVVSTSDPSGDYPEGTIWAKV